MQQNDVIDFFNKLAPHWDEQLVKDECIINTIFDNARIGKGNDVLDVACGTGVIIPDYIKRNTGSITAIDISDEMLKIAKNKYPQVNFICGDAESYDFDKMFENIMIFNAFPHFPNPENLIKTLSGYLKPNGTLTVAHDMSRDKINNHHKGTASKVSIGLPSSDELAKIFSKYLDVNVNISNDYMYQVTGIKTITLE